MKYIYTLLVFAVLAVIGRFAGWSPTLLFLFAALGIIPLAGILGQATEELAVHTGPRVGGLLNATLGNAAELIITLFAIRAGLLDLVKASITGSILGNVLLVLGASVLVGGIKNGYQRFNARQASTNATMLLLAVLALAIPSLFFFQHNEAEGPVEWLSLGTAVAMLLVYVLGLVYLFRPVSPEPELAHETHAEHHSGWSLRRAVITLVASGLAVAWMSEILVGAVEATVAALGISEFFIGIIVVPLIGNAAEHAVAVQAACKNKMELSLAVSLGSSLQIALLVAPVLVFLSLLMGHPLTLVFNQFELVALVAAVLIARLGGSGRRVQLAGRGSTADRLRDPRAGVLLPARVACTHLWNRLCHPPLSIASLR